MSIDACGVGTSSWCHDGHSRSSGRFWWCGGRPRAVPSGPYHISAHLNLADGTTGGQWNWTGFRWSQYIKRRPVSFRGRVSKRACPTSMSPVYNKALSHNRRSHLRPRPRWRCHGFRNPSCQSQARFQSGNCHCNWHTGGRLRNIRRPYIRAVGDGSACVTCDGSSQRCRPRQSGQSGHYLSRRCGGTRSASHLSRWRRDRTSHLAFLIDMVGHPNRPTRCGSKNAYRGHLGGSLTHRSIRTPSAVWQSKRNIKGNRPFSFRSMTLRLGRLCYDGYSQSYQSHHIDRVSPSRSRPTRSMSCGSKTCHSQSPDHLWNSLCGGSSPWTVVLGK